MKIKYQYNIKVGLKYILVGLQYCVENFPVILVFNLNMKPVFSVVGNDPVAMMRWALLRVFFRSYFAFIEAGRRGRRPSGNHSSI